MTDRDPDSGKFIKGTSGNPGGRPKSEFTITGLIDAAVNANDWKFIIGQLLKQARRGNLKAIEMLMDRRFGKALQQTEINGNLKAMIEYVNNPYPSSNVPPGTGEDIPKPEKV